MDREEEASTFLDASNSSVDTSDLIRALVTPMSGGPQEEVSGSETPTAAAPAENLFVDDEGGDGGGDMFSTVNSDTASFSADSNGITPADDETAAVDSPAATSATAINSQPAILDQQQGSGEDHDGLPLPPRPLPKQQEIRRTTSDGDDPLPLSSPSPKPLSRPGGIVDARSSSSTPMASLPLEDPSSPPVGSADDEAAAPTEEEDNDHNRTVVDDDLRATIVLDGNTSEEPQAMMSPPADMEQDEKADDTKTVLAGLSENMDYEVGNIVPAPTTLSGAAVTTESGGLSPDHSSEGNEVDSPPMEAVNSLHDADEGVTAGKVESKGLDQVVDEEPAQATRMVADLLSDPAEQEAVGVPTADQAETGGEPPAAASPSRQSDKAVIIESNLVPDPVIKAAPWSDPEEEARKRDSGEEEQRSLAVHEDYDDVDDESSSKAITKTPPPEARRETPLTDVVTEETPPQHPDAILLVPSDAGADSTPVSSEMPRDADSMGRGKDGPELSALSSSTGDAELDAASKRVNPRVLGVGSESLSDLVETTETRMQICVGSETSGQSKSLENSVESAQSASQVMIPDSTCEAIEEQVIELPYGEYPSDDVGSSMCGEEAGAHISVPDGEDEREAGDGGEQRAIVGESSVLPPYNVSLESLKEPTKQMALTSEKKAGQEVIEVPPHNEGCSIGPASVVVPSTEVSDASTPSNESKLPVPAHDDPSSRTSSPKKSKKEKKSKKKKKRKKERKSKRDKKKTSDSECDSTSVDESEVQEPNATPNSKLDPFDLEASDSTFEETAIFSMPPSMAAAAPSALDDQSVKEATDTDQFQTCSSSYPDHASQPAKTTGPLLRNDAVERRSESNKVKVQSEPNLAEERSHAANGAIDGKHPRGAVLPYADSVSFDPKQTDQLTRPLAFGDVAVESQNIISNNVEVFENEGKLTWAEKETEGTETHEPTEIAIMPVIYSNDEVFAEEISVRESDNPRALVADKGDDQPHDAGGKRTQESTEPPTMAPERLQIEEASTEEPSTLESETLLTLLGDSELASHEKRDTSTQGPMEVAYASPDDPVEEITTEKPFTLKSEAPRALFAGDESMLCHAGEASTQGLAEVTHMSAGDPIRGHATEQPLTFESEIPCALVDGDQGMPSCVGDTSTQGPSEASCTSTGYPFKEFNTEDSVTLESETPRELVASDKDMPCNVEGSATHTPIEVASSLAANPIEEVLSDDLATLEPEISCALEAGNEDMRRDVKPSLFIPSQEQRPTNVLDHVSVDANIARDVEDIAPSTMPVELEAEYQKETGVEEPIQTNYPMRIDDERDVEGRDIVSEKAKEASTSVVTRSSPTAALDSAQFDPETCNESETKKAVCIAHSTPKSVDSPLADTMYETAVKAVESTNEDVCVSADHRQDDAVNTLRITDEKGYFPADESTEVKKGTSSQMTSVENATGNGNESNVELNNQADKDAPREAEFVSNVSEPHTSLEDDVVETFVPIADFGETTNVSHHEHCTSKDEPTGAIPTAAEPECEIVTGPDFNMSGTHSTLTEPAPTGNEELPKSPSKQVVILASNLALRREVMANQQMASTVLTALKIPFEVLDASDVSNQTRRNKLFGISGLRGHYPQFFTVVRSASESSTTFFGDWDTFQYANECGTLARDLGFAFDLEDRANSVSNKEPSSVLQCEASHLLSSSRHRVTSECEPNVKEIDEMIVEAASLSVEAGDSSQAGHFNRESEVIELTVQDTRSVLAGSSDLEANPTEEMGLALETLDKTLPAPPAKANETLVSVDDPARPWLHTGKTEGNAIDRSLVHITSTQIKSTHTETFPSFETSGELSLGADPAHCSEAEVEAIKASTSRETIEVDSCQLSQSSPTTLKLSVVDPSAFGGKKDQEPVEEGKGEERRKLGRSSPIPLKKQIVVPAVFSGPRIQVPFEEGSSEESRRFGRSSPLPPKKAVVVPAAFGGPRNQGIADDMEPRLLGRSSPIPPKKALVVPAAFSGLRSQESEEEEEHRPLRRSSPIASTKSVVVPAVFGGIKNQDSVEAEDISRRLGHGSQLMPKKHLVVPAVFSGPSEQNAVDDVEPLRVGRKSPIPPKKPVAVPAVFGGPRSREVEDAARSAFRSSPVADKKPLVIPTAFSGFRLSGTDQAGAQRNSPTPRKKAVVVPEAFGGPKPRSEASIVSETPLASPVSGKRTRTTPCSNGKPTTVESESGSEPAAVSLQSKRTLVSPSSHVNDVASPAGSNGRTPSPKKLSIPSAFNHRVTIEPQATAKESFAPQTSEAGSTSRQKKLSIPSAFGDSLALDLIRKPASKPAFSKSEALPRSGLSRSEHTTMESTKKLLIPAAFGGRTEVSDASTPFNSIPDFGAIISSSDHARLSKLAIPATFGASPSSMSLPVLGGSSHGTPSKVLGGSTHGILSKKVAIPSAFAGSSAEKATSQRPSDVESYAEASPVGTKKVAIPAAFGQQGSTTKAATSTSSKPRTVYSSSPSYPSSNLISEFDRVGPSFSAISSDPIASASSHRRKVAIPDAFGSALSNIASSSVHRSGSWRPLDPKAAPTQTNLSGSSHHSLTTSSWHSSGSSWKSHRDGAPAALRMGHGAPPSSATAAPGGFSSKYVAVGDVVMTRAAAAAYVAKDGLSDEEDPGDIPMHSSSSARNRGSSSSSSPAPAAPKKKISIPAAFLGGRGESS